MSQNVRSWALLACATITMSAAAQSPSKPVPVDGYVLTGENEAGKVYVHREARQVGNSRSFEYVSVTLLNSPLAFPGGRQAAATASRGIVDCAGKRAQTTEVILLTSKFEVISTQETASVIGVKWVPVNDPGNAPGGAYKMHCEKGR